MSKKEDGFSVVEGLLVLVVVLLVGFIGYYVWNINHKTESKDTEITSDTSKPKKASASTEKVPTTTPPPTVSINDTGSYLTVTEWAIKIPLNTGTEGLSYKIRSTNDTNGSIGSFSSDALKAAGIAGCESNTIEVARGNKHQYVPQEGGTSTTSYDTQYETTKTNESYIGVKVGDNYLVDPNYSGASCAGTTDGAAKEQAATAAIKEAVRKAVAK